MREVFSMWRDTRMIMLAAVVAAVYGAVVIPFRPLTLAPGIVSVRPADGLPVVSGIMFGPAAAWGTAIGGLITDFYRGTIDAGSVGRFVGNFAFGFVSYKMWGNLGLLSSGSVPNMRGSVGKQAGEFAVIALSASAACAAIYAGWLDVLGFIPFSSLGPLILTSNTIVSVVLGPPLLYLVYPRVEEMGLLYPDVMRSDDISEVSPSRRRLAAYAMLVVPLGWLGAGHLLGNTTGSTSVAAISAVAFVLLATSAVFGGEQLSALETGTTHSSDTQTKSELSAGVESVPQNEQDSPEGTQSDSVAGPETDVANDAGLVKGNRSQTSYEQLDQPPESIPPSPNISIEYANLTDTESIGGGGNADVTKANIPTSSGDVTLAIKEPRLSGTLHTDQVERLLEEAETWDRLDDHDHIVGVVDYGSRPIPWIAMEYMDGGHLGERAGTLELPQALWTAIAVTKGVRHAHRRGVAHLDLKSENVLFQTVDDAWDVPKVADWGLSKHLLEHSKSVEGLSPQYAAPEQFAEEYGTTDDITDVYQLGAVFYELFTGRPPFEGKPNRVMRAVLDEQPTPPSEIADVPEALDEVLLTALSKEKADRYDDIVYLRDDLQELQTKV